MRTPSMLRDVLPTSDITPTSTWTPRRVTRASSETAREARSRTYESAPRRSGRSRRTRRRRRKLAHVCDDARLDGVLRVRLRDEAAVQLEPALLESHPLTLAVLVVERRRG